MMIIEMRKFVGLIVKNSDNLYFCFPLQMLRIIIFWSRSHSSHVVVIFDFFVEQVVVIILSCL